LTAVKFWARKKFEGTEALKRKINPTRVPIEEKGSYHWPENLKQSTDLRPMVPRKRNVGKCLVFGCRPERWRWVARLSPGVGKYPMEEIAG